LGGNLDIIKLSREHNNSNILSLGAGFIKLEEAKQAVDLWLEIKFEGGRHQRRIDKIKKIEQGL
jgi:ribose 5-phosphate isomerase B